MAATPAMAQVAKVENPQGFDLYSRFALAGALGCSVTHSAFTPVDVYVFHQLFPPAQSSSAFTNTRIV